MKSYWLLKQVVYIVTAGLQNIYQRNDHGGGAYDCIGDWLRHKTRGPFTNWNKILKYK
jgi:hypothetical protein